MSVLIRLTLAMLIACTLAAEAPLRWKGLQEVNPPAEPPATQVITIVGARLIDGRGGAPIEDSVVVIRGSRIVAAGARERVQTPNEGVRYDARGRTVLPGMIDTHFHIGQHIGPEWPGDLLGGGVTSFRDPGRPFEAWSFLHETKRAMPRAFLTGNHFDQEPAAYPHNAIVLKGAEETRRTVDRFVDSGASGIKIYYRLPLELIRAACQQADRHGVPVMAHLELVRADRAIEAGLDGVEHITSFGTSLVDETEGEAFVARVAAENRNRREARYEMWSRFDFDANPRLPGLIELLLAERTFVSPTLFTFEFAPGQPNATAVNIKGFEKMVELVGRLHRAGVPLTVGSHEKPPNAYARELELLVESGLTPLEALTAATQNGSRFFGAQERIGTLEPGKVADLVLLDGDPSQNISDVRKVVLVMLNGVWASGIL